MNSVSHRERYLPHETKTRYYAVRLYRTSHDVDLVCRRYKVSKASLMRWNKRYDGTKDSLADRSHRPKTPHPNAHTAEELNWIRDYHRRNPHISVCELYGKFRLNKGYSWHPGSLYRVFVNLGFRSDYKKKKKAYVPRPYDTPTKLGLKWQMDVKYVPSSCYTGTVPDKFYQYTVLDEASRERFIYAYKEQSSYSTVDFLKRAIAYFGYSPVVLQTDNGSEFCHTYGRRTDRIHPLDLACRRLGIVHKRIRPRTPRHNGKVERSHRNDQERFYNNLHFFSYGDLLVQMKRYLGRSNRIPMKVLDWSSPLERRKRLFKEHQYWW
jgi:transposase InsO family protein